MLGRGCAVEPLAQEEKIGFPSGEDNAVSARAAGLACVAGQHAEYSLDVLQRVLNTIAEARAPSMRRSFALISFAFLQDRLDAGSSPSILKVYVAAVATFHTAIEGCMVGKHTLIMGFLWARDD